MKVLITNDDGIASEGLHVLARAAAGCGLDVTVAAPHEERSGTSASLIATTEDGRLLMARESIPDLDGVDAFGVEATPAYITWAALRGAFGGQPDLVLSGVNLGPNTGHAVLHSGTVGAALTAVAHGVPALAFSMTSPMTEPTRRALQPSHWETAAHVVEQTLRWVLEQRDLEPVVLNVNVPDVPRDRLRGLRTAPLATFGAVQADVHEVGEDYVAMTFSEIDVTQEPGTDAALQLDGWATVTPITLPSEVSVALHGLVTATTD